MYSPSRRRRLVDNIAGLDARKKKVLPDWVVGVLCWLALPVAAAALAFGVIVLTILALRAIGLVA